MSHISIKAASLKGPDKRFSKQKTYKKFKPVDRSYTTFGGNGCLTKEQYEKGMSLSRRMRHMSSW